jgi:hypothetical protein
MFKNSFVTTGILATLSACSGGRDYRPTVDPYSGSEPTYSETAGSTGNDPYAFNPAEEQEPTPEPFSTPLEGFVSNRIQWSDLKVSVLGARLTRGMNGRSATQVYAEIDVQVENQGPEVVDYQSRGTWDLKLANDRLEVSDNFLGLLIGPGDAPSTTLIYAVNEDATLAGAALQLNCGNRECEPFSIPLDQQTTSDPLFQLTDLQGITAQGGSVSYQVTSATLGRNDVIGGGRAPIDTNILRLDLVVTLTESTFDKSVNLENLLIVIDGNSYEPDAHDIDTISTGTSKQMLAKYSVPEGVTSFDMLFPGPSDSRVRVSVNTANATLIPETN